MDVLDNIIEILKEKKWAKNDIGMGRIQLSKLMYINGNLVLIIKSENKNPIWASVEKIISMNEEIMIFFDGQYDSYLKKNEYSDYENYIDKLEWEILFKENGVEEILNNDNILEKGFYLEIHQNLSGIKGDYKDENLEDLKEKISRKLFH